jgi:hypothetical protein
LYEDLSRATGVLSRELFAKEFQGTVESSPVRMKRNEHRPQGWRYRGSSEAPYMGRRSTRCGSSSGRRMNPVSPLSRWGSGSPKMHPWTPLPTSAAPAPATLHGGKSPQSPLLLPASAVPLPPLQCPSPVFSHWLPPARCPSPGPSPVTSPAHMFLPVPCPSPAPSLKEWPCTPESPAKSQSPKKGDGSRQSSDSTLSDQSPNWGACRVGSDGSAGNGTPIQSLPSRRSAPHLLPIQSCPSRGPSHHCAFED